MSGNPIYSARSVFEGLKSSLHQYLEAQYHIWDEHLIAERRALLDAPGFSYQEPHLEGTPFYQQGSLYSALAIPLAAREILTLAAKRPNIGVFARPYVHQAEALEAFLGRDEEIIVTTGTGSGKTESFLMPILGKLAIESAERPSSWQQHGMRALLLYPMNALVNDQRLRLRRILGDEAMAKALKGQREYRACFGTYTSRTPYPGKATKAKNEDRLKRPYERIDDAKRALLAEEGMWPAKDMEKFLREGYKTGHEDSELLSRHEIQTACPDILITNYSMLEYMLLRPIEQDIFTQTKDWLHADERNCFTVILDEAHMYRGSAGAEVAYLLRRLQSRLDIGRERVRYILTSASLGESEDHIRRGRRFAADLTGLLDESKRFTVITGKIEKKPGERPASKAEAGALTDLFHFPFIK